MCTNNLILAELIPVIHLQQKNELVEALVSFRRHEIRIGWAQIIQMQVSNLRQGIDGVGIPDLESRGRLTPGYNADVVVFDHCTIIDHATFEQPQQYATGISHVIVNGVLVLKDGEHTGATPGRVLRGPGWVR